MRVMGFIRGCLRGNIRLVLIVLVSLLAACTGEPKNKPADETQKTNQAPQVSAGVDQQASNLSSFTLNGTASDDGQIVSMLWTQVDTTGIQTNIENINNSQTQVNVITVPTNRVILQYRLTVTDNENVSASDDVMITLKPDLTVTAGVDQTVSSGTSVQLQAAILTQGAPVASYEWAQISGSPTISVTSPVAEELHFVAPTVSASTNFEFQVTVTSTGNATDRQVAIARVNVTVNPLAPGNQPPTANAGLDRTVDSGSEVIIDGTGTDPDGNISAYSWTVLSGNVSLTNANTAQVRFIAPQVTSATDITLRLTVTDNQNTTAFDDVVITINANQAPTANAGDDRQAVSGESVSITGSGTDTDGTIVAYAWEQIGTSTVVLSGAATQTVSFTAPNVTNPSNISLRLTVTDNNGATASDQVTITVSPQVSNNPPTANAGFDRSVDPGMTAVVTGSGTDTDGTIAAYLWAQTGGPDVTLLNPDTASVSFEPPVSTSVATITLQLTVTDNQGAQGSDTVVITINPNAAPVVILGDDIVDAVPGSRITVTSIVTDTHGIATYAWTQISGPTVTLINDNTANVEFDMPASPAGATVGLRLTASDNLGTSAFDEINVTAAGAQNIPPTANAGTDQIVASQASVTLDGTASNDTDGNIATYLWTQFSGSPTVTLTGADTATASFIAPNVTVQTPLTFQLTVSDNQGATNSDQVIITVNPPSQNVPPVANAGIDQSVDSQANVNLNGSGSDSDGTVASYEWAQIGGSPTLALINANTANASFTAPTVAVQTVFTFELTVTDNEGATGTDQMTVSVNPAAQNTVPVANAGLDQTVASQDAVSLDGSGSSDSDGTISNYQWAQIGGSPTVVLTGANSVNASFTAPTVAVRTELTFELTVTDNLGATGTDQVIIAVLPQLQPSQLSGTITSAATHFVDGDVNDPDAPVNSNDAAANAQALPNPAVVGGYLNRENEGPAGRSFSTGDVQDQYTVTLNAGEVVNVHMGDSNAAASVIVSLILINNATGVPVASTSTSTPNSTMSLSAPDTTPVAEYRILLLLSEGSASYVLTVGGIAPAGTNVVPSTNDDFVPGEVIVRFKPTPGVFVPAQNKVASLGMNLKGGSMDRDMLLTLNSDSSDSSAVSTLQTLGIENRFRAANASQQLKQDTLLAVAALKNRPDVDSVSLNYRVYAQLTPNDPVYPLQWHYPLINLPQAWDITTGSPAAAGDPDVIVAVIDTGILPNHPDLANQLVAGFDFISDAANAGDGNGIDSDPTDVGDGGPNQSSSFHGTHVAGTVAAASGNGVGVAGVAWGAKVMPLRVLGLQGSGTDYDVMQAIRYAAGLGNDSGTVPARRADVINLSLGRTGTSTTPPPAYVAARQAGVIIVAAAGNQSTNELHVPSGYSGVVSVSAVDITRQLTGYSNFGSTVDIAAPGGAAGDVNSDGWPDFIFSTGGSDSSSSLQYLYPPKSGTSMASPHVAGVIALMKSVYPALTPTEFDDMLAAGELTLDLGANRRDDAYGYGLVDAQNAVLSAQAQAAGSTPPPPSPALQVTPTALNFGLALNSLNMTVSNSGGGTLNVSSVTDDANWLTVTPNVDVSNNQGSFTIAVDRTGLSANNYSGTVTVTSDAGTDNINVSMQVAVTAFDDNAGLQIVELRNRITQVLMGSVKVTPTAGVYNYTFDAVDAGTYNIRSSSDLDNDGILCELGESCGAYPTLDNTSSDIVVDGTGANINNLDFDTGFNVTITGQ